MTRAGSSCWSGRRSWPWWSCSGSGRAGCWTPATRWSRRCSRRSGRSPDERRPGHRLPRRRAAAGRSRWWRWPSWSSTPCSRRPGGRVTGWLALGGLVVAGALLVPLAGDRARDVLRRRRRAGAAVLLVRRRGPHPGLPGARRGRCGGRGAALARHRARRPAAVRRVLLPAARLGVRRAHPGRRPRPAHPRRGARGGVAARLRARGAAPRRPAGRRGGAQALPGVRRVDGGHALRLQPGLRRHRPGAPRPHRHRARRAGRPGSRCWCSG